MNGKVFLFLSLFHWYFYNVLHYFTGTSMMYFIISPVRIPTSIMYFIIMIFNGSVLGREFSCHPLLNNSGGCITNMWLMVGLSPFLGACILVDYTEKTRCSFPFTLNGIRSWWQFSFRFWTKWNSIWIKIEKKTVTTIISHSMWKEMKI